MNSGPLETALSAQRPIPTDREELEIERLVPPHKRRVTIADVQRFRAWTRTGEAVDRDADLDDLLDELRHADSGTGQVKPTRLNPRK